MLWKWGTLSNKTIQTNTLFNSLTDLQLQWDTVFLQFYVYGSVHRWSTVITVQWDATQSSLISYSASSLYMFQVLTTPIIRSTQNCNVVASHWTIIYIYFSKFHVQRKAVPYVTITMDNTQLTIQHNHKYKKKSLLLFNRQHVVNQVNGLWDIHMTSHFTCP